MKEQGELTGTEIMILVADEQSKPREFTALLAEAIEESIMELLGNRVLEALYSVLDKRYDITRDEVPYRLETIHKILTNVFGIKGSETIDRNIAHRFYRKLDLPFEASPFLKLTDYVEIAKRKLSSQPASVDENLLLG